MAQIRFDGKVAVVTGAAGGVGRTHALMLAERGAKVVVNDLGVVIGASVPAAKVVVDEIVAAGGEAVADQHDVLDGSAIVQTALDAFGRVDKGMHFIAVGDLADALLKARHVVNCGRC